MSDNSENNDRAVKQEAATVLAPTAIGRSKKRRLKVPRPVVLKGYKGAFANRAFEIYKPRVKLGRSPYSDIILRAQSISAKHAELRYSAGAWLIVDLQSANGTYVNGQRILQQQLEDGDDVLLGEEEFVFNPKTDVSMLATQLEVKPKRVLAALAISVVLFAFGLSLYLLVAA